MAKFSLRSISAIVWIIAGGFGAALGWAAFHRIDEVTRGTGTVIASNRVQVIQSVDGGVLRELRVREGDRVEGGQVLAVLDQTRTHASQRELEAKVVALRAQQARLRAEITGTSAPVWPQGGSQFRDIVEVQHALFAQRRRALEEDLRTLSVAVNLAAEDLKIVRGLVVSGDVSRSDVIRAERVLNEAEAQLVNRRNKYLQDAQAELAKAEDDLAQALQVLAQRARVVEDSVFRANMAGVVKNVRVTTIGGVLRAGDELMQIVPAEDELIVETKVRPADIALVRAGLPVSLRFDSFDYTLFGTVAGKVSLVGADTLREDTRAGEQTYYRVLVVTGAPVVTQAGRRLDILPGMTAQVDIRTGDRSLLTYLLKPLRRAASESFRER